VFRGLLRHLIRLLTDTVLDLRTVPTQSLQELDNLGDFCSLRIASSTVRAMICVMMFAFGFRLLTPVSGAVSALADLIGAVRCEPQEGVGPGGLSKTSTLRRTAAAHVATLTLRRHEIMNLVIAGHPSKNNAADLGIRQHTVENHRASIGRKTKSKSPVGADPNRRPIPGTAIADATLTIICEVQSALARGFVG
jgi:DNA-binding CsgD family transcriptional regulator